MCQIHFCTRIIIFCLDIVEIVITLEMTQNYSFQNEFINICEDRVPKIGLGSKSVHRKKQIFFKLLNTKDITNGAFKMLTYF